MTPSLRRVRSGLEAALASIPDTVLHGLSRMPFHLRRRGLRLALAPLRPLVMGRANDRASLGFSKLLALSPRDARRFVYRKLVHDMIFLVEWLALSQRSVAGLIADARHLSTDAHEDLQWLAAQRGSIIGTMHFGPYSLGIVWLLHTYFQGRKVIILRTDSSTDAERKAIARLGELGADVEFVAPEAIYDFHRLIKAVRGGAVVVIMIDLPPAAGRSDDLDLLGHRVSFASGAVDLAALSLAPLMLLRVRSSGKGDRLEVGEIFDVARHDAGSRDRAVGRIARFVGDTLNQHPEQWHMWERFAEYLPKRREIAA